MEDSDSSQQPKRCTCGFWGSPQTSELCSKCYKATGQEKTQEGLDAKSELLRNRQSAYATHETVDAASPFLSTSRNQSSNSALEKAEELLKQAVKSSNVEAVKSTNIDIVKGCSVEVTSISSEEIKDKINIRPASSDILNVCPETVNATSEQCCATASIIEIKNNLDFNSESCDTDINYGDNSNVKVPQSEIQSLRNKGIKRDISALDNECTESTPEKKLVKSKIRCGQCKCKLELAQRTIGRCKCDNVYCAMHRLPELHNCVFDHKEHGRREAREKMVKPTRHLGTSFRRLDSDSR